MRDSDPLAGQAITEVSNRVEKGGRARTLQMVRSVRRGLDALGQAVRI